MDRKKVYKCPYGNRKYHNKQALYEHMEIEHKIDLQKLPASQVYFNIRNRKNHGSCVVCKSKTLWNIKTEKYERLCKKESCRKSYRQMFVDRMKKVHGKSTLLDDPEFQKKMLKGRKISKTYKWKDGFEHDYTGTYELDFLKFMENVLNWENPNDIMMPAPESFEYYMNGKKHFYIPDVYITSADLYIEIKGSNNHYQKRDHMMELLKDKVMIKNKKINYIKILDKSYGGFVEYLHKRINGTSKYVLKEELFRYNVGVSVLNENTKTITETVSGDKFPDRIAPKISSDLKKYGDIPVEIYPNIFELYQDMVKHLDETSKIFDNINTLTVDEIKDTLDTSKYRHFSIPLELPKIKTTIKGSQWLDRHYMDNTLLPLEDLLFKKQKHINDRWNNLKDADIESTKHLENNNHLLVDSVWSDMEETIDLSSVKVVVSALLNARKKDEEELNKLVEMYNTSTENGAFNVYEITKEAFRPRNMDKGNTIVKHFNTVSDVIPSKYHADILSLYTTFTENTNRIYNKDKQTPTMKDVVEMFETRKDERIFDQITLLIKEDSDNVIGYSFISEFKGNGGVKLLMGGVTVVLDEYVNNGYGRMLKQESLKEIFNIKPDYTIYTRLHKNNSNIMNLNSSMGYTLEKNLSTDPRILIGSEVITEDQLDSKNSRIMLATHNKFKIKEYRKYATGHFEMLNNIPDIEEVDSKNLYDIAVHKVKDMYEIVKSRIPTNTLLAIEDTSLNVNGEEVGGNIRWLINKLETYIGKRATVSIILAITDGTYIKVFRSDVDGVIVKSSGGGYGFDPYFEVKGVGMTLAQIKTDTNRQLQATTNGRKLVLDKIKNNDFIFEKKISEIPKWTGKLQSH